MCLLSQVNNGSAYCLLVSGVLTAAREPQAVRQGYACLYQQYTVAQVAFIYDKSFGNQA